MARKAKIITEEKAWEIYSKIYDRNREMVLKYGIDKMRKIVSDSAYLNYFELGKRKYKPNQVIASARAYGRTKYRKAYEQYKEALDNWKKESGLPKPRKPHQDSLERYIAQMANTNTRRYSVGQADAILSSGKFTITEPVLDKRGNVRVNKDGEIIYRTRKITRNEIYYGTQEFSDENIWDILRARKKELLKINKERAERGEDSRSGRELWEWYSEIIAREFFGSP